MTERDDDPAMPVERWIAILKYRGLDGDAMLASQRRHLQALLEASELVARGVEEIAAHNAAMLRDAMAQASDTLPELARQRTLRDAAIANIDRSRAKADAVLKNPEAMAELAWRCNRQAFDLVNRSILDSLQRFNPAPPETGEVARRPGNKPDRG